MYKWWEGFDGNNDDAVWVQFPTDCAPISVASRPIVSDTYGGCADNTVRWYGPLGNGSIDVPNGALDLAVAVNGSRVYAVGAGGLSVIDNATHSVTSSVPLAGAANVDIATATASVFATAPGAASGSSTLAIYDADASPIGTRTAAGAFAGIAIHPNGSAYVVSRLAAGSAIYIFDAGTHDLIRTISLPSILHRWALPLTRLQAPLTSPTRPASLWCQPAKPAMGRPTRCSWSTSPAAA